MLNIGNSYLRRCYQQLKKNGPGTSSEQSSYNMTMLSHTSGMMTLSFRKLFKNSRFDIQLTCQPANSPDLNVLDLGFFNTIQSLQHQYLPRTIDELITAVQDCFQKLHHSTLNNTFLTLQTCMEDIILHDGNNNYKIRHMSKQQLE
jgi:hypothetical protein